MEPNLVLHQFLPGTGFQLQLLPGGLINQSYSVALPEQTPVYFLQRINTHIFNAPLLLQKNYLAISQQLLKVHSSFVLPVLLRTASGHLLATDKEGMYWRMFEFVKDGITKQQLHSEDEAYDVAKTFGRFTSDLKSMPTNLLQPVLPGFHNVALRSQQLQTAIAGAQPGLLKMAAPVLAGLEEFATLLNLYRAMQQTTGFKQYILHHDAKISNIIFNKNGTVNTPIDMDTTMPGFYFSDAGDMYRSMATNASEDEQDINSIAIRKNFYAAITDGYQEQVHALFTKDEMQYFHASGLLLCFMQCIRFVTDFLNGDTYYKISYPGQNLQRAKNQLALLRAMAAHVHAAYGFKFA
jgi:hypothetical protein